MIPTKFPASRWPWLPYVAPMFAYLVLTAAEDAAVKAVGDDPRAYPIAYAIKIGLVALVAILGRDAWRDLKPRPNIVAIAVAVVLGLIVTAVWVGLDGHYPDLPWLGKRAGYNPSDLSPASRAAFRSVRFFGLVLLVPLIEELFWRSFLMRWLINPDFLAEPIGRVTMIAAALTSIGFALEHPEWLPALLTGAAWACLLAWSKSLTACVISHATANLALGVYVVATGAWKFL